MHDLWPQLDSILGRMVRILYIFGVVYVEIAITYFLFFEINVNHYVSMLSIDIE